MKDYFNLSCKPSAAGPEGQKLGLEYETTILLPEPEDSSGTGYRPMPMQGEGGILTVLENFIDGGMADGIDWQKKYEGEVPIGLFNSLGESITIEPGGQIELSDAPRDSLSEVELSVRCFVRNLKESILPLSGRMLFLGVNPIWSPDHIPLSPKKRYRIMYPHMAKVGNLGQWMMKASAGTQLSVDYASIDDLQRKFRVLSRLAPFLTALFANSPMREGRPCGCKSFRSHIWQNTDDSRCGIPTAFIKHDFRVEDYIQWALRASPYHLNREEEPQVLTDYSFSDLLQHKHPRLRMTQDDWKDHLGMLFPEMRIKSIIEVRAIDTLPPTDVMAVPSLLKALIYDESVFARLETLLMDLPEEEFPWYQQIAARDGMAGKVNRVDFAKIGRTLVEMALGSLELMESGWLQSYFDKYTRQGQSPADLVLERFYEAGENPMKWLNEELAATGEDESALLDYNCKLPEPCLDSRLS